MKKKIISFFLCFLLIFSFPLYSYASDYELSPSYIGTDVFGNGYQTSCDSSTCKFDGSSITWSDSAHLVQTADIYACQFDFSIIGSFSSDDVITINYSNTLGGFKFNTATCSFYENGDKTSSLSLTSSSGSFSYTVLNNVDDVRFIIYSEDLTKSPTSTTASTRFKVTFSVETAETGLLKTIIEYIKGIFSDLQDLPNKISDFFADLKNNLSSLFADVGEWFSQLGDNLKQWFESVGEWFSQLGDNLKQWFEDVGNWFSELFSNISAFFTGLWDDFTEWFKSLFIPRDGYFSEMFNSFGQWLSDHLGFLAQSADVITSLINTISNLDGSSSGVIVFPEIRLPFLDNPLIMERQEFDLLSYINSISVLKQIYQIYQLIVTALFTFLFVKYAYRKFEEILKGREVTD